MIILLIARVFAAFAMFRRTLYVIIVRGDGCATLVSRIARKDVGLSQYRQWKFSAFAILTLACTGVPIPVSQLIGLSCRSATSHSLAAVQGVCGKDRKSTRLNSSHT